MTFVVPFDGSDLAEAALVRAVEFSQALEESVVAVAVIPKGNTEYAKEHGWIGSDDSFEMDRVVETLHEQVINLAPSADFRHLTVDRYAPSGTIASELRRFAKNEDTSMVFIGSENAGSMVTGVSSVGGAVAAEDSYDVVIVRNRMPSKVEAIRSLSPYEKPKSDFYLS